MKRILAIEKCGLFCGAAINLKNWVEYYTNDQKAEIDVLVGEEGQLVDELSKLGVNVLSFTLPKSLQQYGKSVLKPSNFPKSIVSMISYNFSVVRKLRDNNYDKVVFNSYRTSIFYLLVLSYFKFFSSSKIVLRLQISQKPLPILFSIVCWLSDSIIIHGTPSYSLKEFGSSLLKSKKTVCLPNPVNVEKFKFSEYFRNKLRRELGLSDSNLVILSVCQIEPRKGILQLVEAFVKVSNPNAVLIHVGGHDQHPDYFQEVKRAANERVHFLGKCSDVEKVYSVADVFILYSEYEGMPYVVCEAMSVGLPVIATYAGANEEVVTQDVGVLLKYGDTEALERELTRINDDIEHYRGLGAKARSHVLAYYSDKNYYDKLESII